MEAALQAIANPVRREMLQLVWEAERPSGDIAQRLRLSRPAASQHLKVLRDAELVTVRVDGNRRFYRARDDRLRELRTFLDDFWGGRLGAMKAAAESLHREEER